MSVILLANAKTFLQVIHDEDDERIQQLLDAAEDEALEFMDRDYLPTIGGPELPSEGSEQNPTSEGETASEGSDEVRPSVRLAVFLLLKAAYDGADDRPVRGALDLKAIRERAEQLLMPFRCQLGV